MNYIYFPHTLLGSLLIWFWLLYWLPLTSLNFPFYGLEFHTILIIIMILDLILNKVGLVDFGRKMNWITKNLNQPYLNWKITIPNNLRSIWFSFSKTSFGPQAKLILGPKAQLNIKMNLFYFEPMSINLGLD